MTDADRIARARAVAQVQIDTAIAIAAAMPAKGEALTPECIAGWLRLAEQGQKQIDAIVSAPPEEP